MTQFWVTETIPRRDYEFYSGPFSSLNDENTWRNRAVMEANQRAINKLAAALFERFAKAPKRDIETGDYKVEIRVKLTDRDEREVFDEGVKRGISKERAARPYGLDDVYE